MKLSEYFEQARGLGVLATADSEGQVNAAVYARPHFQDEQTVAFIMADRLSHRNVRSNPRAAYLFREDGDGYAGRRLYLTRIGEQTDREKIDAIRRRSTLAECAASGGEKRFLVTFRIDRILPLVGSEEQP